MCHAMLVFEVFYSTTMRLNLEKILLERVLNEYTFDLNFIVAVVGDTKYSKYMNTSEKYLRERGLAHLYNCVDHVLHLNTRHAFNANDNLPKSDNAMRAAHSQPPKQRVNWLYASWNLPLKEVLKDVVTD